jgi:hypothetical protein
VKLQKELKVVVLSGAKHGSRRSVLTIEKRRETELMAPLTISIP